MVVVHHSGASRNQVVSRCGCGAALVFKTGKRLRFVNGPSSMVKPDMGLDADGEFCLIGKCPKCTKKYELPMARFQAVLRQ